MPNAEMKVCATRTYLNMGDLRPPTERRGLRSLHPILRRGGLLPLPKRGDVGIAPYNPIVGTGLPDGPSRRKRIYPFRLRNA